MLPNPWDQYSPRSPRLRHPRRLRYRPKSQTPRRALTGQEDGSPTQRTPSHAASANELIPSPFLIPVPPHSSVSSVAMSRRRRRSYPSALVELIFSLQAKKHGKLDWCHSSPDPISPPADLRSQHLSQFTLRRSRPAVVGQLENHEFLDPICSTVQKSLLQPHSWIC